jgi:hypothetical protein
MGSRFKKKKARDGTSIVHHENLETKLGFTRGPLDFGKRGRPCTSVSSATRSVFPTNWCRSSPIAKGVSGCR